MSRDIEAESVTREDNLLRTSLSLRREDCLLRTQEAHGGVEPAKHSVGTFNANEKIYSRKNPANVNSIKLQGETMNNLTKTNNTSIPNISGIG